MESCLLYINIHIFKKISWAFLAHGHIKRSKTFWMQTSLTHLKDLSFATSWSWLSFSQKKKTHMQSITVTLIFHRVLCFLARSKYSSLFSLPLFSLCCCTPGEQSLLFGKFFLFCLSNSKSLQVTRTLLKILAYLYNDIVWTRPVISNSYSPLINSLGIVPSAPITIDITVTFMFHSFCLFLKFFRMT